MPDANEFVELVHARTVGEATLIHSLLRAHGIPASVPGTLLADPAASVGQFEGVVATRVLVPACDLDRAQALLAEAQDLGDTLNEDADPVTDA